MYRFTPLEVDSVAAASLAWAGASVTGAADWSSMGAEVVGWSASDIVDENLEDSRQFGGVVKQLMSVPINWAKSASTVTRSS